MRLNYQQSFCQVKSDPKRVIEKQHLVENSFKLKLRSKIFRPTEELPEYLLVRKFHSDSCALNERLNIHQNFEVQEKLRKKNLRVQIFSLFFDLEKNIIRSPTRTTLRCVCK